MSVVATSATASSVTSVVAAPSRPPVTSLPSLVSPVSTFSVQVTDAAFSQTLTSTSVRKNWMYGVFAMISAQDRLIDVPLAETSGKRGGIHNSLTRLLVKPSHLIGGYAQLAFAFNYLGPTGNQRDEVTIIRKRSQEVTY